jgi:hypothetical protein
MGSDRTPFGVDPTDTESTQPTGTGPELDAPNDTEGHVMFPDGTSRWLAQNRERDIRKHLSDRQIERQAKGARKRK